jgi:hypothetical protein
MSLEEPEEEKTTGNAGSEMDDKAEESDEEMIDNSGPHENKNEESSNGKFKCHNMCQVSFQSGMKAYSVIPHTLVQQ